MSKKYINKKAKKHREGKCQFCNCDDYDLLDVHRISFPDNKYTEENTVVLCVVHHRLIHSGQIKILGKHLSTSGKYVIHYLENNVEKWV